MNFIRTIRFVAIAVLAVSAVACGGSDESTTEASSDTLSAEQIAPFGEGEVAELRALMASYGAPVAETKCVAEALAGNVDQTNLRQLLESLQAEDTDADIDLDTATRFDEAVVGCGLR